MKEQRKMKFWYSEPVSSSQLHKIDLKLLRKSETGEVIWSKTPFRSGLMLTLDQAAQGTKHLKLQHENKTDRKTYDRRKMISVVKVRPDKFI